MKTMLLAVFGHYDSRGGTTGIPIKEITREELERAIRKYNLDCFGIEEPGERIETTVYGMEARECDKLVHELIYPDTTPGEQDFMYIAQLHYEGDLPEGDLEEEGEVLEGENEGDQEAQTYDRGVDYEKVLSSKPTQLEFVRVTFTWRDRDEQVKRELGVTEIPFSFRPTEEEKKVTEAYEDRMEELEKEYEVRVRAAAKVVTSPDAQFGHWNDDAFGFIIGTGL